MKVITFIIALFISYAASYVIDVSPKEAGWKSFGETFFLSILMNLFLQISLLNSGYQIEIKTRVLFFILSFLCSGLFLFHSAYLLGYYFFLLWGIGLWWLIWILMRFFDIKISYWSILFCLLASVSYVFSVDNNSYSWSTFCCALGYTGCWSFILMNKGEKIIPQNWAHFRAKFRKLFVEDE